jgi:hypothetical protein
MIVGSAGPVTDAAAPPIPLKMLPVDASEPGNVAGAWTPPVGTVIAHCKANVQMRLQY